jgi:hypothetical protein
MEIFFSKYSCFCSKDYPVFIPALRLNLRQVCEINVKIKSLSRTHIFQIYGTYISHVT